MTDELDSYPINDFARDGCIGHTGSIKYSKPLALYQPRVFRPSGPISCSVKKRCPELQRCEYLRRIGCKNRCTFSVSERKRWDRRPPVAADGKGLTGHAGVVLLHHLADRTGPTAARGRLWPGGGRATRRDRTEVLPGPASTIVGGAKNLAQADQPQLHRTALLGAPASDSPTHRTPAALDEAAQHRIAKARARVRPHARGPLHLQPGGFPRLAVAGRQLTGCIVIDIDATIILAASNKAGTAVTFKKTWGFHPLASWCANTQESLSMLLRPGNAGSDTVTDHIAVLTAALRQMPGSSRRRSRSGSTTRVRPTTCWGTWRRRTPLVAPCATWPAGASPRTTRRRSPACPPRPGRRRRSRTALSTTATAPRS